MSNAISGVGTVFQRFNGTIWEALAEIKSIQGPTMSREMVEITDFDSFNLYKDFIPFRINPGEVSLDMNFTYVGYTTMVSDFNLTSLNNYRIILDSNVEISFYGYVRDIPLDVSPDNAVVNNVVIRISGKVTLLTYVPSEIPEDPPIPVIDEEPQYLPIVTTVTAVDIAVYSAGFKMAVETQGASAITQWGWYVDTDSGNIGTGATFNVGYSGTYDKADGEVWQTNPNIAIFDRKTTYYYAAYARNSYGLVIGEIKSFTTLGIVATVNTLVVNNIADNGAFFRMSMSDLGSSDVYEWGWEVDEIESNVGIDTGSPQMLFSFNGIYNYPLEYSWGSSQYGNPNFAPSTTYYYCAYAINDEGTAYGDVLNFTTLT